MAAWLAAMTAAGVLAVVASGPVGVPLITAVYVLSLLGVSLWVGLGFLAHPVPGRGRRIQLVSGLWTLGLFLVPGIAPWLLSAGASP